MDAVFGVRSFRNEIVWCYWGPGSPGQRQFSRKHDLVFWCTVGPTWTWNPNDVRIPHSAKTVENYKPGLVGSGFAAGDVVQERSLDAGGKIPEDWWPIAIAPRGKEYLGYPTQKPIALLKRIIAGASNPGDVVLDPFCGCGTAIDAAEELHRQWIGIDITHLAIGLIKGRLADRHGADIAKSYRVIGEPTTVEDAEVLAQEDKFQFQAWALGLVGARLAGSAKKGGDGGIDGRLYFHDSPGGETRQIIFSVKGGEHLVPAFVHELHGVVDAQKAAIGVLITFKEPTPGMRAEAANAGFYASPWGKHPRIQLRTVGELLDGKGIDYPHVTGANVTVRKAQRAQAPKPEELELFGRAAESQEGYDE
jgi:site-specific DNA-methyltransferase (adenine-specific)